MGAGGGFGEIRSAGSSAGEAVALAQRTGLERSGVNDAQDGRSLARRSRRCCSCPPTRSARALAEAAQAGEGRDGRSRGLAGEYAPGRSGITLRELGGGWTLASDPAAEDAARRLFSRARASRSPPPRPRRSRSSPTCSRSLPPGDAADPAACASDSATATLHDRGLIGRPFPVRRGALPHEHPVPEAVRAAHAGRAARRRPLGPHPGGAGRAARAAAARRRGSMRAAGPGPRA